MSEEEEEEEEEEEKSILERPISRAFVDCSSFKKRTRSGDVVVFGRERKAECIFFPRFNDASETFSLDVLVAGKLDDDDDDSDDSERGGRRRRKNDDENDSFARCFVHFRTDGFVSKPKGGVIYENWYQRAKEALSPRGEGNDKDAYEISIEEKNKKRSERKKEVGGDDDDQDDDDDGEEVDIKVLVWRFPGEEEERPYSGSCDIKRVAEAPETGTSVAGGDATATAATTKTKTKMETKTTATMAVLLELLRHSSSKYIREMEKNVDLKRANECLRRDQELAVKEESRKARDIEQFKRKCLEECLVLVNEKKKRIRELEEILETARKENDALTRKLEKKGGKERRKASSSSASDEEDYSSSEDESDEDEGEEEEEEEEANTDDEDKDTQVRKRMRQTSMADTIKTTASNGGRKKPKSTTTATTKGTASQKQKSKPAARGANTFDALMQANLGRDSDDANSQSSSF